MNKVKVIIKCNGLTIRTRDLGVALSTLNHLVNIGIMENSWVPSSLIKQANDVLGKAIDINQGVLDTMQKQVKVEEATNEEPVKVRKAWHRHADKSGWTIDEDKLVADYLGGKVKIATKDKVLRQNHTKAAIKTRFSILKNHKFDRLGSDRAKLMNAYLSGDRISTPVADIKRRKVYTYNANAKRVSSVDHWTEAETEIIKANPSMSAKALTTLLPGRSKPAIAVYRRKHGFKSMARRGTANWTSDQINAVRLNLHMTPKELQALPWLKDKTLIQLSNKRQYVKTHENK
jgi:uncharacterized protein (DUF2267 family)